MGDRENIIRNGKAYTVTPNPPRFLSIAEVLRRCAMEPSIEESHILSRVCRLGFRVTCLGPTGVQAPAEDDYGMALIENHRHF